MNVLAPQTTATHKQDVKTQLEVLNASVEMALLEMVSVAMVCPHTTFTLHILCTKECCVLSNILHRILQISMNVLAPHTTAIHKRDVKTQLEGLDANVKTALLETVSPVMVCSHSLKHQM